MPKFSKTSYHQLKEHNGVANTDRHGSAKNHERYEPGLKDQSTHKGKNKASLKDVEDRVPIKEAMPYCSKREVFESGVQTTRGEHLALWNLVRNTSGLPENVWAVEAWYKVRYAPARHVKPRGVFPEEFNGLCIHPDKFLRDLRKGFVMPPALPWTKLVRERYQRAVRDYCVKDGTVIYGRKTREGVEHLIAAQKKCGNYKNPFVPSQLNGNNGEFTNADDVEYTIHDVVRLQLRNGDHAFQLGPQVLILRLVDDHWFEVVQDSDNESDEEFPSLLFFCDAREISIYKIFIHLRSALNGNNGSWTNSDDVDIPKIDDALMKMDSVLTVSNPRPIQSKGACAKNDNKFIIGNLQKQNANLQRKLEEKVDSIDIKKPTECIDIISIVNVQKDVKKVKHKDDKPKTPGTSCGGASKGSQKPHGLNKNPPKSDSSSSAPKKSVGQANKMGAEELIDKGVDEQKAGASGSKGKLDVMKDPGEEPDNRLPIPDVPNPGNTARKDAIEPLVGFQLYTVGGVSYLYLAFMFLYALLWGAFVVSVDYLLWWFVPRDDYRIDYKHAFLEYIQLWKEMRLDHFMYAMTIGYTSFHRVRVKQSEYDLLFYEVVGCSVSTTNSINNIANTAARLNIHDTNVPMLVCQALQFLRIHHNIHGFSDSFLRLGHLNSMAPGYWTLVYFVFKMSLALTMSLFIAMNAFSLMAMLTSSVYVLVSSGLTIGQSLIKAHHIIIEPFLEGSRIVVWFMRRILSISSWGLGGFSMINMGIRNLESHKYAPLIREGLSALLDILNPFSDICATKYHLRQSPLTLTSHMKNAVCAFKPTRSLMSAVNYMARFVNGVSAAITSSLISNTRSGPNRLPKFPVSREISGRTLHSLVAGLLLSIKMPWKRSHIMNTTVNFSSSNHRLSRVYVTRLDTLRNTTVSSITQMIHSCHSKARMVDYTLISTYLPVIQVTVLPFLKPFIMYPQNTYNLSSVHLLNSVKRMQGLVSARVGKCASRLVNPLNLAEHYSQQRSIILRRKLLGFTSSVVCQAKTQWNKTSNCVKGLHVKPVGLLMSKSVSTLKTFNFSSILPSTQRRVKLSQLLISEHCYDLLGIVTATSQVAVAYSKGLVNDSQRLSVGLSTAVNMTYMTLSKRVSFKGIQGSILNHTLLSKATLIQVRDVVSFHWLVGTGYVYGMLRNYAIAFDPLMSVRLSIAMRAARLFLEITVFRVRVWFRHIKYKLYRRFLYSKTRRKCEEKFSKHICMLLDERRQRVSTNNSPLITPNHSISMQWLE